MLEVRYKPNFVRQYKKLPKELREEIKEKIALFQSNPNHLFLKTHKLKGDFEGSLSFSVNYKYRVLFEYTSKKSVDLLTVGTHDIYK